MATRNGRLDKAMEDRRLSLGLEWRDVAEAANVSYETLRALRRNRQSSSLTKRRTEDALQWAPGSIDAILAGGEPTLAETSPKYDVDELRELRDQLNAILDRIEEIQRRR